ncbi:MAG TPA: cyclase family protein [Acidimicrobiales bacterium]|nr:cyclase family protein [Acidimicrobiales bacterium]
MATSSDQDRYTDWVRQLAGRPRYGDGDRWGSLNLIDADATGRAVGAVRSGRLVSLARPMEATTAGLGEGAVTFAMDREVHDLGNGTTMAGETVVLSCHGLGNTHVDALNHLSFFDRWYGGGQGLGADALALARSGIFTRAVHADVPAGRGGAPVTLDAPVTGDDIQRAIEMTGQVFRPGDALLLDMGRDVAESEGGPWAVDGYRPGVGASGAEWLADNDVSVLCWDMQDHIDGREPVGCVHMLLWAIGLVLVDNCDFGAYRAATVPEGGFGALLVAPLPIAGATGSNVNPVAIF